MLAPKLVNQELQNEGIEAFIRKAADRGNEVQLRAHAEGRRITVPLANGSTETIDILSKVTYEVRVNDKTYLVVIEIGDPPNGLPNVVMNTIPEPAPGGAVLAAGATP